MNKNYTLIDKAFVLKKTPMFSSLELDLLLPIADKMHPTHVPAEEVIFGAGEQAYSMFFITEGTVSILSEQGVIIATLQAGEVFGDEAVFSGRAREYEAKSQVTTELLTLSRADLLAIIYEYPRVATGFLEAYTKITPFRSRQ
jgi:CRP/FNR family transcriptional regulator, cyclic AMP receptor protein